MKIIIKKIYIEYVNNVLVLVNVSIVCDIWMVNIQWIGPHSRKCIQVSKKIKCMKTWMNKMVNNAEK